MGNPVAPSSVTSGDSFPPRGSLWAVQPHTKKRPKSGRVHGPRNSPSTGTMRHDRQNERASSERALKKGGRGPSPATLCVRAFSRESLDPPPGTGRGTTSQVWTCAGPNPAPLPGAARCCVPFGWVARKHPRGAVPRGARLPGGGPHFSREMGRKRAGASPLDPGFYSPLAVARSFWGSLSLVR